MLSQWKWVRLATTVLVVLALLSGGLAWAKKPPKDPPPDPDPPPMTYEIIWLGTLGGSSSMLADINDLGDVVGHSDTDTGESHAFLNEAQLDGSRLMIDLNSLIPDGSQFEGGKIFNANAINNAGQIAGPARINDGERVFYRYTPGATPRFENLGATDGVIYEMNNHGTIVGTRRLPSGHFGAFRCTATATGNSMEFLNDLIDPNSGWFLKYAYAINDAGEIVGGGNFGGFLFIPPRDGETWATVVGLAAGAWDISERTHVACGAPALLYTPDDGMLDLGSLNRRKPNLFSCATGVNDLDQVVGLAVIFKEDRTALFLSLPTPTTYEMLNVDDLLDPLVNDADTLARWYTSNVTPTTYNMCINNPWLGEGFGQIGSTASDGYSTEAFLLTPVPPVPDGD